MLDYIKIEMLYLHVASQRIGSLLLNNIGSTLGQYKDVLIRKVLFRWLNNIMQMLDQHLYSINKKTHA